jgi:glycosyltransferase 2 family protein
MMTLASVLGLVLASKIAVPLARWRYSRWFATLATDIHRVLLGSKGATILSIGCLTHRLTILIVWLLGQAQGLALPLTDAAVLFTAIIAVLVVPISISGWGVRELAVVSLLGAHGVAPERKLLLSVCFGLTATAGSLPGALAWFAYPFAPIRRPPESLTEKELSDFGRP